MPFMDKYLTFQKFDNKEEAEATSALLKNNGIDSLIEIEKMLLDQVIAGKQYNDAVLLKIAPENFKAAQKVLIDNTEVDLAAVDPDYMLLSMSKDELTDIISSPDEWGAYNYKLALTLLKQKGIEISDNKASTLQEEHVAKLSEQENFDKTWMLLGYSFSILSIIAGIVNPRALLAIYGLSLLPGILGPILGITIVRSKKTLPDGRQVQSYDENSMAHGRRMLYLGLFAIAFNIVMFIVRSEP